MPKIRLCGYIAFQNHRGKRGCSFPAKDRNTLIEQSVTQNKAHRVVKEVVYEANKDSET